MSWIQHIILHNLDMFVQDWRFEGGVRIAE